MNCREYASKVEFEVVGKLKRMPDHFDPFIGRLFPWYMDEAENEYHMHRENGKMLCDYIVTKDNKVI